MTYFTVTFPCTVTANVHFFTLYVILSAKCMVYHPYLIADMSWLCTGWVKGRWREGPRMSDGWRPCGQDSLLLGFHLRGKQLHISENILSETSVYCTNVLEKPAYVSSMSLQKNGNIYRLHCVTSQKTSVLMLITMECYSSYRGLMFTNGLHHVYVCVCVCVHTHIVTATVEQNKRKSLEGNFNSYLSVQSTQQFSFCLYAAKQKENYTEDCTIY